MVSSQLVDDVALLASERRIGKASQQQVLELGMHQPAIAGMGAWHDGM